MKRRRERKEREGKGEKEWRGKSVNYRGGEGRGYVLTKTRLFREATAAKTALVGELAKGMLR